MFEKILSFVKKNAKIRGVEILKNNPFYLENYTVTYIHTLEEVPGLLRLEKPDNNFLEYRTWKKVKIYQKKC